jgi:RNA polymerase sigma-70 factor (ECF subfamily)
VTDPSPQEAASAAPAPVSDACGSADLTAGVVRTLIANHDRFLAFLQRRVQSRAVAEDILQEAFVRGIDRARSLRAGESAVAWFYRLLRNALIDHKRRAGAEQRALASFADESTTAGDAVDPELHAAICACLTELVDTLKPEYAEALRQVDLGNSAVPDFATQAGITTGNAGVRLHRARQALRRRVEQSCGTCAQHGCWQCECTTDHHPP